ncbi:MAG: hypothetical protein ACK504_13100 [Bacteroidota bacterium]|jgi:hypothetical protein
MHTDFLLKQLNSSLTELKIAIEKFEKHSPLSINYTEQLFQSVLQTHKFISAYVVLKERDEISTDLDLHLKLMEVTPLDISEEEEKQPTEKLFEETKIVNDSQNNYPKLNININDKFRFINELFSSNAIEYNIAIEQLNATNNLQDAKIYINGLKNIYFWKEENELLKTLQALIEKRFL